MSNSDLDELAAELAEFAPAEKKNGRPASEERVIAGFEEIQRFTEQHGRAPQHGEDRDIFERLYAVRLDRLRALPDCRALLEPLDHQGLLAGAPTVDASADETVDIDDLAAELADVAGADDITVLRHVRTSAEKRAAEEIADRKPCEDFETFRPSFERVQTEVKTGMRQSQPIEAGRRAIEVGDFFVLDGLTLYVAEVGEPLKTTAGEVDRRLRAEFLRPELDLKYQWLGDGGALNNEPGITPLGQGYQFGVGFQMPLFLRRERGELAIAKLRLADASLGLDRDRLRIRNRINERVNDINTFADQVRLGAEMVVNNERLLAGENQRFAAGESSLFLVNAREVPLIDTRIRQVDLEARLRKAYFSLDHEAGTLWRAWRR